MSPTCDSNIMPYSIAEMYFSKSVVTGKYIVVKFQVPNLNTSRDMNYFPPFWSSPDYRQTDYRQKAMHKSPPCNLHRWAQKGDASWS